MAEIQGLATAVLETTEALVVVLDAQGRITFFNRACETLTGYSRDDVLGKVIWDVLIPQRHVAAVKQVFADLSAGEQELGRSYENPWLTRDGRERLIAWSNGVFTDASGAVSHVIGTGLDIAERQQVEDVLRATNQTLEALIQASPVAIMTLDTSRNVTSWNLAAERIFGWTAKEVLGHPIPFVPEESLVESAALFRRVLDGESLAAVELRRRRRDGSPVHISLSTAPLFNAEGRMSGVMGVAEDVTERVRAEAALRQSEQLYRDVVALVEVGVSRFDLEGRRTFVNEALVKRYGVPAEELLQGKVADRKLSEDRERDRRLFRQCIETGKPVSDIIDRHVVEGRTHYTRGNLIPIFGDGGKVIGVQATSVDITDLIDAQERLGQSDQFYRAVMEATDAGVAQYDLNGNRRYVNEAFARCHGKSIEELLKGRLADQLSSEEEAGDWDLFRRCIATGNPQSGTVHRIVREGEVRYTRGNFAPLFGADGKVAGVQVTSVDVTELVLAQQQLQQAEELYRSVTDTTEAALARFDLEGRRTFVNEALVRRLGRSSEHLLTGRLGDTLVAGEAEKARRAFRSCVETGKPARGQIEHVVTSDGRSLYVRADYVPLCNAEGAVTGVQVTSVDVTELVQAQKALKRSEELYRSLVNSVGAAVIRVDREGRRTFVSEYAAALSGETRERMMAGRFGDLFISADERDRARARIREIFQTGKPVRGFVSREQGAGGPRYFSANWEPIRDASGNVSEVQVTSFDITELVEAQQRLRESDQFYREIVALAELGVARFDLEGRRIFVNDVLVRRTGMSREELVKGVLGDRNLPEDRERAQHLFSQCVATGKSISGIIDRFMAEGRVHYVKTLMAPLFSPAGQVTGVQITSLDITDLMESQGALKRSEEMYRSLVDSIGGAVIRVDREGKRTFVSQPASRFTGRQWQELLAGRFGDTMATEQDRREAWALLEETFNTGKPVRAFTTRQVLHGKLRHVAANWEPLRDSQGNVVEIQMTSFDVTDQVEAQERLRRSEELYRSLMNAVPLAVVRVNRDGQRTFVSTHAAELSGMSEEEFLRGRFGDPMVPEDREKALAHLSEVFRTGQPVRGFVNRQVLKGKERFVSTTFEPIKNPSGEVVEVQTSSMDVTEMRRLQDQYYQAQKMESVGRLAGGVAHDFNNLLTAILGYSELGMNALPEDNPVRGYLDEIQRTGERAAQLTRQLLAFSRRQVIQARVLNLNGLMHNMDRMLRRLIGEDVQMAMSMSRDLWHVRADPGLIEQVLVNLVVNAHDAMPRGGRLTIETSNTTLPEQPTLPAGDYVALSVSDTGIGMTEEVMRHVFEPFYTTKPHGTGLGLSTCYGIVTQSGGDIQLRSEVGKGTTVVVYLPRVDEPVSEQPGSEDSSALPTGVETVLLVEDDASVRRLAARVLARQGYTVLDLADGHEALRMLTEEPNLRVHLLLTDVVMPHMGGKELSERLLAMRPNVKVLFISGYTDDAVARHGVLEPGLQLLNKPFSAAELARKVREVLDS